ncbi:hypothetical protein DP43_2640 [Burkholderia pseudomallei]|nr:hypothetical protein DP43_2640 [Burkholderia pseudomallei]
MDEIRARGYAARGRESALDANIALHANAEAMILKRSF